MEDPTPPEFGFDDGDTWLDALREADRPMELGRLGSWELLEEIDRGGQGIVWRARHATSGCIAALKRPLWGALAGARTRHRFEREIEAASGLDHPGIVKVIGRESVDGQPVLALEWVEGERIDAWAARHRHVTNDILRQFLDIGEAVAHAHQRGVIHRDLKPSNILVDADGFPRVLDFGLAKIAADDDEEDESFVTRSSEVLGTPAYAAPEQLSGRSNEADARSDVYALSIVLFEMLTGVLPYDTSGSLLEVVKAVLHTDPLQPSRVQPALHRELDLILLKGLSKAPEDRYATVNALNEDILRHLHGDAILAHPPSTWYQLRKVVRRHRAGFAVAIGFVVLVVAFGITTAIQASRIATERDIAHDARDAARAEAGRVRRMLALFTRDVFHAARPMEHGAKVTLETCLTQLAETSSSSALADDPALVVEVKLLLTDAFSSLGRYAEASVHAQAALTLADDGQELLPNARGRCRIALGLALKQSGNLTGAFAHLEQATAQLDLDANPADDETFVTLALARGDILGQLGQLDAADKVLASALDRVTNGREVEDASIAEILHGLASLRLRQGRPAAADALSKRALDAAEEAYGFDHVMTATAHTTRGTLLATIGQYEDAETHHHHALRLRRKAFGGRHPHAATNLVSLACLALQRQDHEAAHRFLGQAATILEESTLDSSDVNNALAALLLTEGKTERAVQLYSLALVAARKQLGDDSADVATIKANLGPKLFELGKTREGRAMTEQAVATLRRTLGSKHPRLAHGLNGLAHISSLAGDPKSARAHYAEALGILDEAWPEPHPYRLRLNNSLASVHWKLEAFAEVERFARVSLEMEKSIPSVNPTELDFHDSRRLLIAALCKTDQAAAALPIAEDWVAACTADLEEGHELRLLPELYLGIVKGLVGRHSDAVQLLEALWERVSKRGEPGPVTPRVVAEELAKIFKRWGKPALEGLWRGRATAK